MSILWFIALALPFIAAMLFIWPCLLLAAWADTHAPHHPDLD